MKRSTPARVDFYVLERQTRACSYSPPLFYQSRARVLVALVTSTWSSILLKEPSSGVDPKPETPISDAKTFSPVVL